jgi:hypothetical protein
MELSQKVEKYELAIHFGGGGDFNMRRFSWENLLTILITPGWMFNSFIMDHGLMELCRKGNLYTWTK